MGLFSPFFAFPSFPCGGIEGERLARLFHQELSTIKELEEGVSQLFCFVSADFVLNDILS
jgi:hypothetical protein